MAVLPTGLSYTGYNGALVQVNGGGNGLSGSVVDGRSDLMPQIARTGWPCADGNAHDFNR